MARREGRAPLPWRCDTANCKDPGLYDPAEPPAPVINETYWGTGEVFAVHELTRTLTLMHKPLAMRRAQLPICDEAKNRDLIFLGAPNQNSPSGELRLRHFAFQTTHGITGFSNLDSRPRGAERVDRGDCATLRVRSIPPRHGPGRHNHLRNPGSGGIRVPRSFRRGTFGEAGSEEPSRRAALRSPPPSSDHGRRRAGIAPPRRANRSMSTSRRCRRGARRASSSQRRTFHNRAEIS